MNTYPHPADLMALPCGGIAFYDYENEIGYRCAQCCTMVGSIDMPQSCKDAIKKWDNWQEMGGEGWNYRVPDNYMDDWS